MTDTAPQVDPGAPAQPAAPIPPPSGAPAAPPAPTEQAPAAPPAPAADPIVDPFDYGQEMFPRKYVEQLRNEAASRRTTASALEQELNPFKQAFERHSPADRETLLGFSRMLAEDPASAAQWMVDNGQAILEQSRVAQEAIDGPGTPPAAPPGQQYMTADQVQALLHQNAAAQQREQLIAQWNQTATGLGYNPTSRPDDADGGMAWLQFQQLVKVAETTGGDLQAAHQRLVAYATGQATQQVQQRVAASQAQNFGMPPQPTPAAPADDHPMSESERWQRIDAQVKARMGQGEMVDNL